MTETTAPAAPAEQEAAPRLSVIGTGYLGATHAACMAELGFEVLGVDVDPAKIERLARGEVPFHEPGLPELLRTHVASGRLRFTTDVAEAARWADVHFIGVGTPQKVGETAADLSYVDAAVASLAAAIDRDALIVGTGEFFRGVETTIGRLRDRLGALVRGRPAPPEEVETALETGLHAVMVEAAAAAAEQIERRWASEPAGRALVAGRDLGALAPDASARAADVVRDWQSDVLALVQEEGAGKRTRARLAATGVNGAAVALMIISFASTGGLAGIEVGIAGGAAVVGQKLLESIFGEDAVRRMARRADELLELRVRAFLETVLADRFLPLLHLEREPQATEELRALVPVLRRGVAAGVDGPTGPEHAPSAAEAGEEPR